ncbi:hypothetical protein RW1_035_00580 [Rhodococcus wratislaviensis NBRC 100605]|uniref:Uncharacterized protein n=1 Tax=Rhodococcus wratislaviensis NBRC 100605 TaxID=1219028 RepID=X0PUP4_RHOWR|nr:hypothetical protein RW1_035_00580 [Rhodococcus wratislaviensis NBRC 100605]
MAASDGCGDCQCLTGCRGLPACKRNRHFRLMLSRQVRRVGMAVVLDDFGFRICPVRVPGAHLMIGTQGSGRSCDVVRTHPTNSGRKKEGAIPERGYDQLEICPLDENDCTKGGTGTVMHGASPTSR